MEGVIKKLLRVLSQRALDSNFVRLWAYLVNLKYTLDLLPLLGSIGLDDVGLEVLKQQSVHDANW